MKYISFTKNGTESIITFPGERDHLRHDEVAKHLGIAKENILGAGFFMEIAGKKFFTGESASLDIESRGDIDRDLYIEQCRRA